MMIIFPKARLLVTLLLIFICGKTEAQYLQEGPPPSAPKQKGAWWTLHLSMAWEPNSVKIGNPGVGWGTALLFPLNGKLEDQAVPVWMGLDFNYHYFGTEALNFLKVHYENWQLAWVFRITNASPSKAKPFMDFELGGRYLVALTSEDRSYAGILLRRTWDVIAYSLLHDGGATSNDYNIRREYGKLSLMFAFCPGVTVFYKKSGWTGITLKGRLQYGTQTHFINRNQLLSDADAINHPPKIGTGLLFGLQLGFTL